MAMVLVSPAESLPVSLAELKAHLRIDTTDFDAELTLALNAAINDVEEETWRALITQEWRLSLPRFPSEVIVLPKGRLQSVDTISYLDVDGVETEIDEDDYVAATDSDPGMVFPAYYKSWPVCREQPDSVKIEFTCGYGDDPENVPAAIRQAILIKAGWYFEGPDGDRPVGGTQTIRERSLGGLLAKFVLRDERIAEVVL